LPPAVELNLSVTNAFVYERAAFSPVAIVSYNLAVANNTETFAGAIGIQCAGFAVSVCPDRKSGSEHSYNGSHTQPFLCRFHFSEFLMVKNEHNKYNFVYCTACAVGNELKNRLCTGNKMAIIKK
jgi:hypothetical protein